MLTSDRMAAVDENAAALGVPRKQLMESSGNATARAVRERAEPGDRVAIVGGRGNNGGDGFVAARFLEAFEVTTLLLGRAETIGTEIAGENWDALQAADHDAREVRDATALEAGEGNPDGEPRGADAVSAIHDADVVVDAILGTGVSGALREPAASAARRINESDATVVAVDVPSGVDADTGDAPGVAVEADHVVTFHDDKPGLAALDASVTVADIGIPDAAEVFVERGDLLSLDRGSDTHKGDHGDVLVIGGGPYTGAPALTAQAALRAGGDLARVATPGSGADRVQGYSENLIVEALPGDDLQPGHVDRLLDLAADRDVVVLGPGLGRSDATLDAAREFLSAATGTVVVDADPLRVVPEVETDADLLCTPHRGELVAMGGPEAEDWRERAEAVEAFAGELGVTLLVKGPHDVISDGETTRVGRTGNPGMTVGGTGDVLAGVCGALAATQPTVRAAAIAAYANGKAGDLAYDASGYGLVATDLLDRIPAVLWGGDGA